MLGSVGEAIDRGLNDSGGGQELYDLPPTIPQDDLGGRGLFEFSVPEDWFVEPDPNAPRGPVLPGESGPEIDPGFSRPTPEVGPGTPFSPAGIVRRQAEPVYSDLGGFHPDINTELGGNDVRRHDTQVIHDIMESGGGDSRVELALAGALLGASIFGVGMGIRPQDATRRAPSTLPHGVRPGFIGAAIGAITGAISGFFSARSLEEKFSEDLRQSPNFDDSFRGMLNEIREHAGGEIPPGMTVINASYTEDPVGLVLHNESGDDVIITPNGAPQLVTDVLRGLHRTVNFGGTPGPNQQAIIDAMTPAQRSAAGIFFRPDGEVAPFKDVVSAAIINAANGRPLTDNQTAALGLAFNNIPDPNDRRDMINTIAGGRYSRFRDEISAAVGPAMRAARDIRQEANADTSAQQYARAGINNPDAKIARLEAAGVENNAEAKFLALHAAGINNPVERIERLVAKGVRNPVQYLLNEATQKAVRQTTRALVKEVPAGTTYTTKAGRTVSAETVARNAAKNLAAGKPLTPTQQKLVRKAQVNQATRQITKQLVSSIDTSKTYATPDGKTRTAAQIAEGAARNIARGKPRTENQKALVKEARKTEERTQRLRDAGVTNAREKVKALQEAGVKKPVKAIKTLRKAGVKRSVEKVLTLKAADVKKPAAKIAKLRQAEVKKGVKKVVALKEAGVKKAVSKAIALDKAGVKKGVQKIKTLKDAGVKKAAKKVVALKDAGVKRGVQKVVKLKDAGAKKAASKVIALKRAGVKQGVKKVVALKEAGVKRATAKVLALKKAGIKDGAKRLEELKRQGVKNPMQVLLNEQPLQPLSQARSAAKKAKPKTKAASASKAAAKTVAKARTKALAAVKVKPVAKAKAKAAKAKTQAVTKARTKAQTKALTKAVTSRKTAPSKAKAVVKTQAKAAKTAKARVKQQAAPKPVKKAVAAKAKPKAVAKKRSAVQAKAAAKAPAPKKTAAKAQAKTTAKKRVVAQAKAKPSPRTTPTPKPSPVKAKSKPAPKTVAKPKPKAAPAPVKAKAKAAPKPAPKPKAKAAPAKSKPAPKPKPSPTKAKSAPKPTYTTKTGQTRTTAQVLANARRNQKAGRPLTANQRAAIGR